MRLLFAGGCPSLLTNRICLGAGSAGDGAVSVELMPLTAPSSRALVLASLTPNRRIVRQQKVHRPGARSFGVVAKSCRQVGRSNNGWQDKGLRATQIE